MSTAVEVRSTPEQYLALEPLRREFKSEYIDGGIRPMSGREKPA